MVAAAGAPVSEQAQRRMRSHFSLQEWLDTEASKIAWGIAILSIVCRGASFYSGSAGALTHLMGHTGMLAFDGVSGIGIAFGCEMLTSIAGRAWRRNKAAAHEVMGAAGLKRAEREAARNDYLEKSRIDRWGMTLGMFGTTFSSFMFLLTVNPDHSPLTIINEALITVMLVGVMVYLGVFNTTPRTDPSVIAADQAMEIRGSVTDQAGRRIASGMYAPDDVYIVAGQLPARDKQRFIAALVRPEVDDPMWGTREMCEWLGLDSFPSELDAAAARRRLTRLLNKVAKDDARVQKDDKGRYQVPRSLATQYLMDLFLEFNRPTRLMPRASGDANATPARQPDWLRRLNIAATPPPDASQVPAGSDAGQGEGAGTSDAGAAAETL